MPADGDRQVEAGIRLRSLCEKIVSENRRGDVSFLSELREYTGINEVRSGAKKILLMGPEKVIVKLGGKGAICIDQDQEVKTGIYPVHKVLDPTGAGDVFGGGFISGLSEGLPIINAMRRGTALASFCIEDFGVSMLDNITKDDIDHRIFELEN